MSKKSIKKDNPDVTAAFFGAIDTSLFFTYGVAQFFTGAIGDTFNKRKVLSCSFFIQAIFFVLIGLSGYLSLFYLWYFCLVFSIIGLV
jgi:sugar phosphate permease